MRKLLTSIIICFLFLHIYAQHDSRAVETKVADLLMQFPADNSSSLTTITQQLAEIGPEAVKIILNNLATATPSGASQLKYALSGMIKYMSKDPLQYNANVTGHALIKSLMEDLSIENKNFVLEQLSYIALDDHLPYLAGYLLEDDYADVTSRLMTNVGSNEADRLLLNSLTNASDFQKIHIIKAIASIGKSESLDLLHATVNEHNTEVKLIIFKAFANHGFEAGLNSMKNESIKEGFVSGVNTTTHSYLQLLGKLVEQGKSKEALEILPIIIGNESSPNSVKVAALRLLSKIDVNSALPALIKNVSGTNKELRQSSLNMIAKYNNPEVSGQLLSILQKSKDDNQIMDIMTFFSNNAYPEAIPLLTKLIKDKNDLIKIGAMHALYANDPKKSLVPIAGQMKKSSPSVVLSAQAILLRTDIDDFNAVTQAQYAKSGIEGKVALLDLIGKRKSKQFSDLVFKETNNKNVLIRNKAIAQLSDIATSKNTTKLFDLLKKSTERENIQHIQNAILIDYISKERDSYQKLIELNLPLNSQTSYKSYNLFARIGGDRALQSVRNDLKVKPENIDHALDAFNIWSNGAALNDIFDIVVSTENKTLKSKAISSYLRNVNRTPYHEDQRLLLLRKIQPIIEENDHKSQFIRQASSLNTLQSLNLISQYLDESKIRQTAINSIYNIILNSDVYGVRAKNIIEKAISLNTNSEAKYVEEAVIKKMASWPKDDGYVAIFNGKDLTGWKGLVENPIARNKMSKDQLSEAQRKANERMRKDWRVEGGVLVFEGAGYDNLCTEKMYGDFELLVDWRLEPEGDGGVYLRGSPQVQTWDTSLIKVGAQVGSGGLYNNQKYVNKPLMVADNPINEWNTFRIKMIGDKVTVYLNGQLVTDNVILENYWDRSIPIFDRESLELQAHGTRLEFRDIYVKEIHRAEPIKLSSEERLEGFNPLFNGMDLDNWIGNKVDYFAQDGMIVCQPTGKGSGNLFTEKEYDNFIMRFEFQLTPGANNGLGIRTSKEGDPAYVGMELQILDNKADIYKNLFDWQYHGSVYGVIAAKRDFLKPLGEWNVQEVYANGNHIKITLNGQVIVDGDIHKLSEGGKKTIDGKEHPGLLNKKGHIGFLGHGSPLKFRNIRIKELR